MKVHEYLTLRRAAHELFGWDDTRNSSLRLRRLIQRKERATGKAILIRHGGPFYVTKALLRDHMPELFSRRDSTVALVKKKLEEVLEGLAECKLRDKALAAKYRSLDSRVGAVEARLP